LKFWIASRFFPYLGGKHFLVKKLLPLIPTHEVYVEVFGGAAALLFAKDRSPVEVYNDVDKELVNLFTVVRDRKDGFLRRLEWLPYSRELYYRFMAQIDAGKISDPVERAAAFYYCMRSSFSGRWHAGWAFGRARQRKATAWANCSQTINAVAERLRSVYVDCLDFRRCIKNWDSDKTFFFLDPPYPETEQARPSPFSEQDHRDLDAMLRQAKGKWLLTYGNHPLIRQLYNGQGLIIQRIRCPMASRKWGQGPRSGKGALVNLVIRNYSLKGEKI